MRLGGSGFVTAPRPCPPSGVCDLEVDHDNNAAAAVTQTPCRRCAGRGAGTRSPSRACPPVFSLRLLPQGLGAHRTCPRRPRHLGAVPQMTPRPSLISQCRCRAQHGVGMLYTACGGGPVAVCPPAPPCSGAASAAPSGTVRLPPSSPRLPPGTWHPSDPVPDVGTVVTRPCRLTFLQGGRSPLGRSWGVVRLFPSPDVERGAGAAGE